MQIPPVGLIVLVLGLGAFAFRPRALYRLFIISIPFTATAVINYQGGSSGHWLPATNYLGLLCLAREFVDGAFAGRITLPRGSARYLGTLLLFVIVATGSLFMPAWINGSIRVISADLEAVSYPLVFNGSHLIHLSQLALGVAVTVLVIHRCRTVDDLRETMRLYIVSLIFVCAWGWLEFLFFAAKINFHALALFVNNIDDASLSSQGRVLGETGIKRITSVAVEPSILAQSLLVGLPLVMMAAWERRPLLSRRWDLVAIAAIMSTLLLSASSSAYVGLAFALLVALAAHVALRGFDPRPIAWVGVIALGGFALYATVPVARTFVDVYLTNKLATDSGIGRVVSTINGFYYFLDYPVLGVGWGTITTYDLVVRLLANTGVIGLAAFLLFAGVTLVGSSRSAFRGRRLPELPLLSPTAAGISVGFLSMIFVMQVAGFAYEFLHLWLIFGLAMAAATIGREQAVAVGRA